MEQPISENNQNRLNRLMLTLIFIGTIVILVLGISLRRINEDIVALKNFLDSSRNIQANFEQSLTIYTDQTKYITDYLLQLRPSQEEHYIKFISGLENIAAKINIEIDVKSQASETEKIINYQISFLGKKSDLFHFIQQLEQLPNYIKVQKISYSEIDPQAKTAPNVQLLIALQVK